MATNHKMRGMSQSFDEAIAQLHAGDAKAAEDIAQARVEGARSEFGDGSADYAAAQYELAQVLTAIGDLDRSIAALRAAVSVAATDEEAQEERLTYLMSLGETLHRAGALDEAEDTLRAGAQERADTYGADEVEYAYALEPLAEVLLTKGDVRAALEVADEAVLNLWQNGDSQVASVLALRAFAAQPASANAFEDLAELPAELLDAMINHTIQRAQSDGSSTALSVLRALRELIVEHRGPDDEWLITIAAVTANVARTAGDHVTRIAALEWMTTTLDREKDAEHAANASLALAIAYAAGGRDDDSERAFRDLMVEPVFHGAFRGRVLRSYSTFLVQRERTAEAATILSSAVTEAKQGDDEEEIGVSLVALGIRRHHDGATDEAKGLLEEALTQLPPIHPDTLIARTHLVAVEPEQPCGCQAASATLTEMLQTMVREQVPSGLLGRLGFDIGDNRTVNVSVSLGRDPQEAELMMLNGLVQQAVNALEQTIADQS